MDRHAAFVVGSVDYGESDRIVRLLTPDLGRVSAIARRARTSRRRWGALFELGTQLHVDLAQGRGGLRRLSGADPIRSPHKAREDFDRITLLAYGCEVCAALAPEDHPAPRLYGLLEAWLGLLEGETTPGTAARIALEAKALTFAGLTPALLVCARCGGRLEDRVAFDAEAGGGVHVTCGRGVTLDARGLLEAEALRRTPMADVLDAPTTAPPWLLSDFVRHHTGRPLKSRALLEASAPPADRDSPPR